MPIVAAVDQAFSLGAPHCRCLHHQQLSGVEWKLAVLPHWEQLSRVEKGLAALVQREQPVSGGGVGCACSTETAGSSGEEVG